ncbi:class C sortase [Lacticaseibacillus thailandensis]|nr:class C sortase [Lacticaseibacillus thailandensis]
MRQIWARIILVAGLCVCAYPFVSQLVNDVVVYHQTQRAADKDAAKYAARLQRQDAATPEDSFDAKNLSKDVRAHLLGSITIARIGVRLPLFDNVGAQALHVGAGVVPGTDAPTGGRGTHTAISAHSGVPSKRLFTNLHRLRKGDTFVMTVAGKHYAYQVFRIQTVLPTAVRELAPERGEDLATLITCTPYMVNSHRLLVTGRRVPYTAQVARATKDDAESRYHRSVALLVGIVAAILSVGATLIWRWRRKSVSGVS